MLRAHHVGTVISLAAAAVLAGTGFAVGSSAARAAPEPRRAPLLTGVDWRTFGFREKGLYLSGFIAGAAAEQARARAPDSGGVPDSGTVSSAAIEELRRAGVLQYSYAPAVYVAQLDDFYWWENHRAIPIVDVMIATNRRMREPR